MSPSCAIMQDANKGAEGDSGREEERPERRVEVREVVLGALGPWGDKKPCAMAQCGPAGVLIASALKLEVGGRGPKSAPADPGKGPRAPRPQPVTEWRRRRRQQQQNQNLVWAAGSHGNAVTSRGQEEPAGSQGMRAGLVPVV